MKDTGINSATLATLANKRILLGMTGGIAAYKCAELTRLLSKAGADVRVQCRGRKLGRSRAVCDCLLFSEGDDKPVARASLTYSLPPVT